jgi:hypothetical protein
MESNYLELSHMKDVGVSYGVFKTIDGTAYLSAAFTNTNAGDVFNKKRARKIIMGRIYANIDGRQTRVHSISTNKTARQIIKDMRAVFKPDGITDRSKFNVSVPIDDNIRVTAPIIRTPCNGVPTGYSVWDVLVGEFKLAANGT